MSVSRRLFCAPLLPLSCSSSILKPDFLFHSSSWYCYLPFYRSHSSISWIMSQNQKAGGGGAQQWKVEQQPERQSALAEVASASVADGVGGLSINDNVGRTLVLSTPVQVGSVHSANHGSAQNRKMLWKPNSYSTVSGVTTADSRSASADKTDALNQINGQKTEGNQKNSAALSKLFSGSLLESFTVDNSAYAHAQIRATFYPKFENEKSDQEVRTRMIEMVSKGLATLEVSLKHSGSLFMYAGNEGGAYAKNSFGNIYTAVGVFVLGRMFREAWGSKAAEKQAEFNHFLETNHMCISMELVTAVLGDHGQRPREDYVVVTAVTELGKGKPKFYSTPELIAFCRKWRLPTNDVWLFSTRKSVSSFFAAYDALCEEGTATTVCKALNEVADISIPGSKDHTKIQGEILEGLVARIVSHGSIKQMEDVSRNHPPPPTEGSELDLGPSLRDICAANRSDEKQQIKALLENVGSSFCPDCSDWYGNDSGNSQARNADKSVLTKFLQAHPSDFSTTKLQEVVRLMREKRFPAAFKCYHNLHKLGSISSDNLFYKMVIHVRSDSGFRRFQKEMRQKPGLWPLYRGFFVDISLFKANKERAYEIGKSNKNVHGNGNSSEGINEKEGLADDDANLMIKLKFLTYKLRTFLIRNGLSVLFKEGPGAYKAYYLRQMKNWGTSAGKQRELSMMLDEWAVYIRRKYGHKQLSTAIYLSEAEPFLEQYAKRSPLNQSLIGSAGSLVRAEDFMAIIEGGHDEEGDLETERREWPVSPSTMVKDTIQKDEGLIVFFPGIPGCAKSALCKEILNTPGGLGDDRPVHSLMGDLIKGKYWPRVADEYKKKPYSITLADKNAPNEEVWRLIEDMCSRTKASAVPVVPDSEGTDSNPFSLDALAVFMFRVLQRVNHPGNLDKSSPNAGYVLLMFYHLYKGKSRQEFEGELVERFGSLVKMPLLKSGRSPLPEPVKLILQEGICLYNLHVMRHGRSEPTKGSYSKEWEKWENQLRATLFGNAEYLNSIQVPFEFAVQNVMDQLKKIAKGEYIAPSTEKRKLGTIVFAAIDLPVKEIQSVLDNLAETNPKVEALLMDNHIGESLNKAHVTLAHKRSHGVTAVVGYSIFLRREVPVKLTALLFTDKMAAFEASIGSVDGEQLTSKNEWPHVTIWTAEGVARKESNTLSQLHKEGEATLLRIDPPITISGTLQFY